MKQAERDSSHAPFQHSYKAVTRFIPAGTDDNETNETAYQKFDADEEEISMGRADDDGMPVDDRGSMALRRRDLGGKDMTIQEIGLCVQGTRMLTRVPMVTPYSPTET